MFRIECFCDDKNLAKLKWALFELGAYNVTDQPVKDSKSNGKAQRIPKATFHNMLMAYIKDHKLKEMRADDMRAFVVSIGLPEAHYGRVRTLLREGIGQRTGTGGTSNAVWKIKPVRRTKKRAAA